MSYLSILKNEPKIMTTSKAEIITYKPGAYCQLRLANGERILIGCAQTGIKISKLAFAGIIPTKTIASWPITQIDTVVNLFGDENNLAEQPLDAIKRKLMTCSSIQEVKQLCEDK